MPITFKTESHSEIPIGFFNIDTDLLIIRNHFVFAKDFCSWISNWACVDDELETIVEMFVIHDLEKIGHLMGAISGVLFTGFIGEVYKKFPFPEKREDFKQKPDGDKNRGVIESTIKNFAKNESIEVVLSKKENTLKIGDYIFTERQFHEVIIYIWRGGMPGWKDDVRPEYVNQMMRSVVNSKHWFFIENTSYQMTNGVNGIL